MNSTPIQYNNLYIGCIVLGSRVQSTVHCVVGPLDVCNAATAGWWSFQALVATRYVGTVALAVASVTIVSIASLPPNASWSEQFLRQNISATFVARTLNTFGRPPNECVATGTDVPAQLGLLVWRNSYVFCLAFSALRYRIVPGHLSPPPAFALSTDEIAGDLGTSSSWHPLRVVGLALFSPSSLLLYRFSCTSSEQFCCWSE